MNSLYWAVAGGAAGTGLSIVWGWGWPLLVLGLALVFFGAWRIETSGVWAGVAVFGGVMALLLARLLVVQILLSEGLCARVVWGGGPGMAPPDPECALISGSSVIILGGFTVIVLSGLALRFLPGRGAVRLVFFHPVGVALGVVTAVTLSGLLTGASANAAGPAGVGPSQNPALILVAYLVVYFVAGFLTGYAARDDDTRGRGLNGLVAALLAMAAEVTLASGPLFLMLVGATAQGVAGYVIALVAGFLGEFVVGTWRQRQARPDAPR